MPRFAAALACAGGLAAACATPRPAPYAGPFIDVHAHLIPADEAPMLRDGPTGAVLPYAERAGVAQTALIVIAKRGDLPATRADNDAVIARAAASKGRLYPVASVHPADGDEALEEVTRVARLGVRWLKLHPTAQHFDVSAPEVGRVLRRASEHHMVVLFDGYSLSDANQSGKFVLLAFAHPRARIVLAHFGGARFDELGAFALANRFPRYTRNVWFDLSASAHFFADSPYEAQLVWLARQIGTDRILFGSDFPVDTPAHAIEDIRRLGFSPSEERQIFYENAARLLAPVAPLPVDIGASR